MSTLLIISNNNISERQRPIRSYDLVVTAACSYVTFYSSYSPRLRKFMRYLL